MCAVGPLAVAGAGLLQSCLPAGKSAIASEKKVPASPQKQWAKEHYQGIENLLLPSYSPDFKTLDPEGIRNDVRNSIRHGFFSTTCIPVGVSTEEHKQFLTIACEEAKGKILAGDIIAEKTEEGDMAMIAHAEKVGCTHLLITPNRSLRAKTEEELYQGYLKRITATTLPVLLYAPVSKTYASFGPSGVPIKIFDRLTRLPNVVGIKLSQGLNLTTSSQICEALAEKLLVGPVNLDFVPTLAKLYHVQWSGQWNVESVQSPEKPYAVELMKLINARRFDEAMKVYAALEPALDAFYRLQAPLILKGVHPWPHMKYFQWCTGGNGGLVRNLASIPAGMIPTLDDAARSLIRKTYQKVGITTPAAPEEEFLVGKAAYNRGARTKDMTEKPYYL
jgi:4-hydroxy-tetrahydrodipicolinate synthase